MAPTGTTPEAWGHGHGPIVGVDHPVYPLAVHATYTNGPGPHHDSRAAIYPNKNAVDYLVAHGTTVIAIGDGRISKVGPLSNTTHDPGLQGQRVMQEILDAHGKVVNHVYYAHLSAIDPAIQVGAMVTAGQPLGQSGTAGGVAHLHIAVEHGSVLTLDSATIASHDTPAKAVDHPFNLHLPVPDLRAPHVESEHPGLNLTPPLPPGIPGYLDFHPTPPAQHGLHLEVPHIHLGPYGDLTSFPSPDAPPAEPNPGNAERATDHSLRDPDDLLPDAAAQAEIAVSKAGTTVTIGLHSHPQKGDAEPAPPGYHPPPHDPQPPKEPPHDPGQTDHAAPFGLHLPVPHLHADQSGGRHEPSAPDPDSASPFNLHLLKPAADSHHPGATTASDRHDNPGPEHRLDPTFGHGSGTPFKLELDPSAGHHGTSVHEFDLQLHQPGVDGGDAHHGATPFNLQLDAHSPSEHSEAGSDSVHGTHGAPHDGSGDTHGAQLHETHVADAVQVADVAQGGSA